MSLLPSSPEVSVEDDPRVVGLDSEDADALMRALSSDTAREVLAALHDEPAPPSELADRVDTTLQNAQYHLERLSDAGAIEVVGTAYSEKGREMDVYAPADRPLVIFAGQEKQASGLRAALSRLIGGLAALLAGAIAIQEVFGTSLRRLLSPGGYGTGGAGGGGGGDAGAGGGAAPGNATGTQTRTVTDTATPTATPGGEDVTYTSGGDGGATPTPTETSGGGGPSIFNTEKTATPAQTPTPSNGGAAGGGAGGGTASPTSTPMRGDATVDAAEATATAAPSPTGAAEAGATATPTPAASPTPEPVATATPTATPTPTNATMTATETARTAAEAGGEAAFGLPPGLVFFVGGALVLGVAMAMSYR